MIYFHYSVFFFFFPHIQPVSQKQAVPLIATHINDKASIIIKKKLKCNAGKVL